MMMHFTDIMQLPQLKLKLPELQIKIKQRPTFSGQIQDLRTCLP